MTRSSPLRSNPRGPATPVSLNEMRFFFSRAALGAGAPFGIGEELVASAIWLASAGADPAALAAPALDALASGASTTAMELREAPAGGLRIAATSGAPLSALFAGPALADRLALAAPGTAPEITLENVDQPVLAAACVAALHPDAALHLRFGAGAFTLGGQMLQLAGCTLADLPALPPGDLVVTTGAGLASDATATPCDLAHGRAALIETGLIPDPAPWAALMAHFAKSLVPSSEASRLTGAGAGLTDND